MSGNESLNDPLNNPLAVLRHRLQMNFAPGPKTPDDWSDTVALEQICDEVYQVHDHPTITVAPRLIAAALKKFRRKGKVGSFRELKFVCLGVGTPNKRGWCVLEDEHLLKQVFQLAERAGDLRREILCFQALLRGYWAFPRNAPHTAAPALAGWRSLGNWLARRRRIIEQYAIRKPGWFTTLAAHDNLLSATPCDRYGDDLLHGDDRELIQAVQGLAIPPNSWVMEEALRAAAMSVRDYALVSVAFATEPAVAKATDTPPGKIKTYDTSEG